MGSVLSGLYIAFRVLWGFRVCCTRMVRHRLLDSRFQGLRSVVRFRRLHGSLRSIVLESYLGLTFQAFQRCIGPKGQ